MKPLLGLTMGDAAGIGPEIIIKVLSEKEIYRRCRPLVIGDLGIMNRAADIIGNNLRCRTTTDLAKSGHEYGFIDVLDMKNLPADLPFAALDPRAGKAAYEYVEKAVNLTKAGEISAIVTAPLNKEALNLAGYHYSGHTEILAHLCGTKNYAMMLIGDNLRVIHVTTHVALSKVCDLIKKDRILKVIDMAQQNLRMMGIKKPRIAVAGLNPHSGEGGLFGYEDVKEITPAVNKAKLEGLDVTGPVAPDTVFYRAAILKHFDIVVVMYHDQGHIPVKLFDFNTAVNMTAGLPLIRTSVDHGTAFDKAGKGTADHRSMKNSIFLAAQLSAAQTGRFSRKPTQRSR